MLTEPLSDTLVLHKSTKDQQHIKRFLLFLPILFVLTANAVYVAFMDDWDTLWAQIQANPTPVLLMGLLFLVILALPNVILFYRYQALKRERLILDASVIRYQSNLPRLLQGLMSVGDRDWSTQWAEITAIYLKLANIPFGRGSQLIVIGFHLGLRYHETSACQWVTDGMAEEHLKWPREQKPTPEQVKTALQSCPVIRYISDKGLKIEVDSNLSLA